MKFLLSLSAQAHSVATKERGEIAFAAPGKEEEEEEKNEADALMYAIYKPSRNGERRKKERLVFASFLLSMSLG